MTSRKTHSAEFKRDAINRAEYTGHVSGTARDFGVSDAVLRKWIKASQRQGMQAFPGQGRQLSGEQEEIKRLRQENDFCGRKENFQEKPRYVLGRTDAHEDTTRSPSANFYHANPRHHQGHFSQAPSTLNRTIP
ncbi:transposase [Deinococcus peraridilitoris]|uniref:transposase n=1 Tax=Deinococcus peraridilitoris TaxID=432329 RepID=UPI0012F9CA3F